MCVPRTIVRPNVRFSSDSTKVVLGVAAPGAEAEGLFGFRRTRRNSSVSASTRFMCCGRLSELGCNEVNTSILYRKLAFGQSSVGRR